MELFNPASGLIFWMLIVFGTVLFILGKYAFPVIVKAIEKREAYITESLRKADEVNEQLRNIQDERAQVLKEAREEQNRILKEVQALRDQLIEEAKQKAQVEADQIVAQARQSIELEKQHALKDVRNQVAKLSVGIAGKVLRKNLETDAAQTELVSRILEDVTILN
jgi:F-type H+-transporting ATPase subunit b